VLDSAYGDAVRFQRVLVLTVAGSAVITFGSGVSDAAGTPNYQPLPAKVRHEVTSVPSHVLSAVGTGDRPHAKNIPPSRWHGAYLTKAGKPEVAYILAEFCPYCAAESWSVIVATSRFGTFTNLTTLQSSSTDVDPRTQTISFRYSHFHSRYLTFDSIVNEDMNGKQVEKVPPKVKRAWRQAEGNAMGYPFIDFAGRAVLVRTSFDPHLLHGLSRAQIAGDLTHPSSPIAKAIDGTANQLTGAICIATKNTPKRVCSKGPIPSIEKSLKHLHGQNHDRSSRPA
jgi:hypothetical protein